MSKNTAEFKINLTGDVVKRARTFGAAVKSIGADGSRSMRLFGAAVRGSNSIIDKFDNKLVGIVTGGGLAAVAKKVGNQQQLLTELGARYNLTADQVTNLNNAIWSASADRKLPYADLIGAVDSFLERTNSLEGVTENLDNIALAVRGVGLESKTAGDSLGTLWNKGVKNSNDMLKTLDGIASASLSGTGNLNEQISGLIGLASSTGWNSSEQLLQLINLQRLSASEFGNSGQSATALQSFFDAINDPQKRKILNRNGVKTSENGQTRNPADLLLDIGNAAKFKKHNLADVFSGDMLKLALSFSDTEKQQQLKSTSTRDGIVNEKASQNVATFNGALT